MKRLKNILFIGLSLVIANNALAQPDGKREVKEIYFNINYTYRVNDTIVAFLDNARNLGIENGTLVKAFQSYKSEIPGVSKERNFKEVGLGKIIIYDTLIACYIKVYRQEDSIEIDDMVSLNVSMPALPLRTVFSELSFKNIIYTNVDREPLYYLRDVIYRDNKKLEDSIYTAILTDLKNTYERIKDRTNLPEVMYKKLTDGRFKGRTPLEILRDATRNDLESFFQYVTTYTDTYMGNSFRASEIFAGWLSSNSPYSHPEIKNILFPIYKNKAAFNAQLPIYKKDILAENSVRSFAIEATVLSEERKFVEANELADFALALAYAIKDTLNKPIAHICKAQVLTNQEKYKEALIECDKTIKAAVEAKDADIESQAIIKKAYCYMQLLKYNDADSMLSEATIKSNHSRQILKGKYNENMARIYEYRSSIKYKAGEYDRALALLDSAIYFNNQVNTATAQIRNAEFYSFAGRVNNDQGKPRDALTAFNKASTIYKHNSDQRNKAIVENDIAFSYYKLGEYKNCLQSIEKAMATLLQLGDDNNAGYSKSLAGTCYWQLGKYDSAVAAHKESILLRKKAKNFSGQAFSWKQIGEVYKESGSKTIALQAYDSASVIYKSIKDSSGLAEIYNKKGEVFLNDENYKRAAEWFEKANGVSSKSTIEALYQLGDAWYSIDTVKSVKYYDAARLKSAKDGNTDYQFYSARSLAFLAYRSHDLIKGDTYYDECVSLSKQINTAAATAKCLSLKAWRYESETELDSALMYYQKALAIFDSVDRGSAILQLNNISSVHISKGEFQKADDALAKAIQVSREMSDSLNLGNTLQLTTFLYSRTADFSKGIANSDNAINIFRKSGNMIRLANAYGSRGTLLSSMGEYKKSIDAYLFADSLYKEELLQDQRGVIYNNIGVVYIGQKDYTNAMKYLDKALSTMKKGVVDESYMLTKGNIGESLAGLKKNTEAKSLLQEIFPKAQKMKLNRAASGMALVLGKIYLEENNLNKAAEYYSYARDYATASGEKEKTIDALVNLGRIYIKQKNEEAALSSLRNASAQAALYKTPDGWEAYYELGLLYYNQQKFDSSINYFKQAVLQLDKNTENLYGGEDAKKIFNNDPKKSDLYNKITFSYYNLGNIKEAWAYANRSNIAGIKELSGNLSVNSSDEERNDALKKLLAMQQSRKALENTLEKQEGVAKQETLKKIEILEADYNNFLQDVVQQYPELSTYFTRSNADEFNNYKGKLPDDVAVMLYLLNDKTLMIFTLTNEKLAVDTMTADLSPKIASFIETINDTKKRTGTGSLAERSDPQDEEKTTSNVEFKDISDELYNVLIATVSDKISGKKKLCIIPTGIFSNMPFQCLGKKSSDNSFRFLLEDHLIFYTNKMSVFNSVAGDDSGNKSLSSFAAFGVPDAKLKFNITEVQQIGKILGSDSTVYTDSRATESMAKQSLRSKKYIHFATHGVLNYSTDYSLSYLKLLPDKDTTGGNNGQLTMREVQKLGITDCNMVILSACQTAVAQQLVKGWSISPANSFLVSHVKTVVASLWKVADEPTGLLMQYFYENLNTKMEKSEALRQAQIKLSQDARFRHPNYWGAFVLYGDWR